MLMNVHAIIARYYIARRSGLFLRAEGSDFILLFGHLGSIRFELDFQDDQRYFQDDQVTF